MLRGFTSQDTDDRFQRAGSTISKHIKKIRPCLEDFTAKWVAPMQDQDHWSPFLEKNKKYRHFKDCIGAVDGTHIPCQPPLKKATNYWCRKGMYTFNVLTVDFNLCFTFAVSGYEGAMDGYQIFKEETLKMDNRYPHPPPGNYNVVDAGYPNVKGYLALYKGYMYHQDDFMRRSVPVTDSNERFNKVHSSVRSCVERSLVLGLHNYIRMHYPSDEYFSDAELSNEMYVFEDRMSHDIRQDILGDAPQFAQTDRETNLFCDGLRDSIASDYSRQLMKFMSYRVGFVCYASASASDM
ncbi:hypothetical protein Vadar_031199 [Vaccinium darrowii]|uniref:Uncharacterized protein n=1 Tax=Vaccinium darrowii TaxID=229202 RepID=A0ACB7XDE9_9ERIC|nr:hypothetical protein Vadar_031199 [Vaccinium darrowii]